MTIAQTNTYNNEELPVWPEARRAVPVSLTGKTSWSHSIQSPVLQATSGAGAGQVLAPSPNGDAPDASVTGNAAIPPLADRADCATATGTFALASMNAELTSVQSQLTAIGGMIPAPTSTITSVAATNGALAGGTNVTITGTGFATTGSTVVTFNGVRATNVVVVSATSITCTTPAGAQVGPVGVTVTNTNPAGAISSAHKASAFTYNATPSVPSGVSPNVGTHTGGTAVTIAGSGFTGATGVTIGGTAATGFVLLSDSAISCVTPAGTAGPVNVVVQDPAGNGTLTNGYTFT